MSLFKKLFGSSEQPGGIGKKEPEHAVIVFFQYGETDLSPIFELENKLDDAIRAADAGEFDGNEVASDGSDGYLYMYGPDADSLFQVIEPILKSCEFMKGAEVKLRYGPPEDGVPETTKKIMS